MSDIRLEKLINLLSKHEENRDIEKKWGTPSAETMTRIGSPERQNKEFTEGRSSVERSSPPSQAETPVAPEKPPRIRPQNGRRKKPVGVTEESIPETTDSIILPPRRPEPAPVKRTIAGVKGPRRPQVVYKQLLSLSASEKEKLVQLLDFLRGYNI